MMIKLDCTTLLFYILYLIICFVLGWVSAKYTYPFFKRNKKKTIDKGFGFENYDDAIKKNRQILRTDGDKFCAYNPFKEVKNATNKESEEIKS